MVWTIPVQLRFTLVAGCRCGPLYDRVMDLSGRWRASPVDDELRRSGVGLDFDDSAWEHLDVPGHWRSHPRFADCDGPVLYRTRFDHPIPLAGERIWVVFEGIFYQADVWLDGAYLGDPEGYFFPHSYDITPLARLSESHALAVDLNCAPQRDRDNKRAITGAFQHSGAIDPDWNPGGIWRPVRVETTGPVRIERLRVLCREANEDRADVQIVAELDCDANQTVRIRTTVGDYTVRQREQSLAHGTNEVSWTLGIDNPKLWWPWSLGDADLTDVTVEVIVDHRISHAVTRRVGFRSVSLNDWILTVNGERIFVKGVNYGPTRRAPADADKQLIRRDLEIAKDTGFDLVRVHTHIAPDELYEAADELGMMVWQDFPLHRGYSRHIGDQAAHQVRQAVDLLGHHPSIVAWCGHNEPNGSLAARGRAVSEHFEWAGAFGQQLPSWNRTLLDRRVKRAFERCDESRPVIASSGVLPHVPQLDGSDTHLYLGWYTSTDRDLVPLAANLPRLVRFVGEFGCQSVPDSAEFIDSSRWPDLDWEALEAHFGFERGRMDYHVPPLEFDSFDEWRTATQAYQAGVLRHHIETLRRLKYSPTGGFCVSTLTDPQPAIGWGLLDHRRIPKLALDAVAEACRPLIVVADRLPDTVDPGAAIALDIHVVSEARHDLADARLDAVLRWTGGSHTWQFTGEVPADSCVRIGTIRFIVPAIVGLLELDLGLTSADGAATNRYKSSVVATP
jgi:beta-mannosidase